MAGIPNIPGGGTLQERAAQLKAQMEAAKKKAEIEGATQEEEQDEQDTGPVGQGDHVVAEGECISSIAKDTGHFWETIWNDPANTQLREVRKDPNVLFPRDRVTIPELVPKEEPGETEMRHRFVRRGEPVILRLVLRKDGEPRANEPYTLTIDGHETSGVTDPEGKLEHHVPGNAKQGKLVVGEAGEEFSLLLGDIDPKTTVSGVQARLNNLGYAAGEPNGELTAQTVGAIEAFQADNNLPVTGKPDEQTQEKLVGLHGS